MSHTCSYYVQYGVHVFPYNIDKPYINLRNHLLSTEKSFVLFVSPSSLIQNKKNHDDSLNEAVGGGRGEGVHPR